jgi:uncharacterized membrane protein
MAKLLLFAKSLETPENMGSRYTLKYFIQNPNKLVAILYQTFMEYGEMYIRGMIGDYMGYVQIRVFLLPILVYILLLIAACIRKEEEPVYIGMGTRVYMWIIFVTVCAIAVAAMLLYWTDAGSYVIEGVQGRYFLPALPIALIACRSNQISVKSDMNRTIMFATVYIQVFVMASFFRNFGW